MMTKILFMVIAWVMLSMPAFAEEKTADAMISAVQSDLNRYEPMVASMRPGSRSGARVSRFVPVMESRLNSSRHQQSAAWIETSGRLQALKQALLDIKSGKKPSVPSSTAVVEKPAPVASSHAPAAIKATMSDPDRARKIDALNSEFVNAINRIPADDFAKPNVVGIFIKKIAIMQDLSAGFQDNSLGYVQQVNGFIVDADRYLQKRIAATEASIKKNKQMQAEVAANNKKLKAAASAKPAQQQQRNQAKVQSERMINGIHRTFSRAFSSVRGSLAYLNASTLAKPEEAQDWTYRIKKLKAIVDKYQDKTHPTATKDIAIYHAVKERFDKASQELAINNKKEYAALLLLQSDEKTRQAAMEKQQHMNNLHQQFNKIYNILRISGSSLNAETLADPEEAQKWSNGVKKMGEIVGLYQNKKDPDVIENIAIYNELKTKVESGLAEVSAATGGLTPDDLLRDHQALQELVVKYKPFFSKLNPNNTASLTKIESFNQGSGKTEIETALASFAQKYGDNRVKIAAKFKLVNGGQVWRSPQRYVPESGFERLSEWMNNLNAGQETALASKEDNSGIKMLFAFPGGHQVDVKFPILDIANTNQQFEKARHALDAFLEKYPNREKARQSRDELDSIKQKFIDGMNKAIDDVRWEDRDNEFTGPGDVDDIKDAAIRFLKLKGKVLAFGISSYEWYVNDEDIHGHPINYALTFKYAEKIKNKPDTAMIKQVALVTAGASRSLPFVKITAAGGHWEMRIKNLP